MRYKQYKVFDWENLHPHQKRPRPQELPPALYLAVCQNLPPLQHRCSGTDPRPQCSARSWSSEEGGWLCADCSWEQPQETRDGSGEREQPRGDWERELPPHGRSCCGTTAVTAPSRRHRLCTACVAAEGLPAPPLPQFAGWRVAQAADEDKLSASHPQKYLQHRHTLVPFPGCRSAGLLRITLARAEPRHVWIWRSKTKTKHPEDIPRKPPVFCLGRPCL